MSIRSQWCEFDKETRKYIKKRDNNECVICHKKGALQIMHIFLSRAHGGKGCKENGVLGCVKCHRILDNPIGEEQIKESKKRMIYCKDYLIGKEHIKYNKEFINSLKFNKQEYYKNNDVEQTIKVMFENKCKNCKYFEKYETRNSTIKTGYCHLLRKIKSKNNKICKDFKSL